MSCSIRTIQFCSTPPFWPFRQSRARAQICQIGQAMLTAIMPKKTTRIQGAMLPKTSRVASFMTQNSFEKPVGLERTEHFDDSGIQRKKVVEGFARAKRRHVRSSSTFLAFGKRCDELWDHLMQIAN